MLVLTQTSRVCMCALEISGDLVVLLICLVYSGAMNAIKGGVLQSLTSSLSSPHPEASS